jgi:chromosome segregation ATPase
VKNREQAQELLRSANANLSGLDGEMVSISQEIRGLDQQIQAQLSDLSMSYDALPAACQTRIFQEKPSDQAEWINTVYPQASDLAELAGALKLLPQNSFRSRSFREAGRRRNQAHARWSETNGSLENARRSLPPNWEALQLENEQLSSSKKGIDVSLDAAKRAQEQRKTHMKKLGPSLSWYEIANLAVVEH